QTPRFCGFCSIAGTFDLAFCGSRPLRISWLIVGMKPSPFIAGNPGGYFAQRNSAKSGQPLGRLAIALLSNVQLLPGASDMESLSRGRPGPIAGGRLRVNRPGCAPRDAGPL